MVDMNRMITFSIVMMLTVVSREVAWTADQCLVCHQAIEDKPSALFKNDIHQKKGVSCAGCHGGNPALEDMEESMSAKAGFIGVPKGDEISKICAGCHAEATKMMQYGSKLPTDQFGMLTTSVHGKLSITGKERIAQCTTCHNAHGIQSASSRASPVHPLNVVNTCSQCHANARFMQTYNPSLPVDQREKYRTSIHGMRNARGDAKVAQCASCHGSHEVRSVADVKSLVYATNIPQTCSKCHSDEGYMKGYKIPTDQYAKFVQSVHGVALLEKRDVAAPACNDCHGNHGAVPPGVESISKVCGTCHALNADLFSKSPHKKAFDTRRLPECETCHGNHEIIAAADQLLGIASGAVCSRCHTEKENVKGYKVARTMRALIDSLEYFERYAIRLVAEAEQKGMEISEAKFKLRDARQARLQSRTMVHSFDEEQFREIVNEGLVVASIVAEEGQMAIEQYYFRRWGLGISMLIISVLAVSLYFFIRRIERKQQNKVV
jgi:predicted CXXCH cytochrome family protein